MHREIFSHRASDAAFSAPLGGLPPGPSFWQADWADSNAGASVLIPELAEIGGIPPVAVGSGKFRTPWERMQFEYASPCEYPFELVVPLGVPVDPHAEIVAPSAIHSAIALRGVRELVSGRLIGWCGRFEGVLRHGVLHGDTAVNSLLCPVGHAGRWRRRGDDAPASTLWSETSSRCAEKEQGASRGG